MIGCVEVYVHVCLECQECSNDVLYVLAREREEMPAVFLLVYLLYSKEVSWFIRAVFFVAS